MSQPKVVHTKFGINSLAPSVGRWLDLSSNTYPQISSQTQYSTHLGSPIKLPPGEGLLSYCVATMKWSCVRAHVVDMTGVVDGSGVVARLVSRWNMEWRQGTCRRQIRCRHQQVSSLEVTRLSGRIQPRWCISWQQRHQRLMTSKIDVTDHHADVTTNKIQYELSRTLIRSRDDLITWRREKYGIKLNPKDFNLN